MSDGSLSERERLVYSAKLAEQAERYDGERDLPGCFCRRGVFGIPPFLDPPFRAVDPSRRRERTSRRPDDRSSFIFTEMVESMKALCKLDSVELSVSATTRGSFGVTMPATISARSRGGDARRGRALDGGIREISAGFDPSAVVSWVRSS